MFDLYITSTAGREVKALRSPYPTRLDTESTVSTVVRAGNVVDGLSLGEAREFARTVSSAPLGETVREPKTGVSFRTEKV